MFFVYVVNIYQMDVCDLPHDVLVLVGSYMTRKELNGYSLACKKFNKVCNDDSLWYVHMNDVF